MKKLLAMLLALCLLFGAFAIAETPAEAPAAETEIAAEETPAEETPAEEAPAEETAEDEPAILENGWILTAEEALQIAEPIEWMADKENIAFFAIMLMLDAYNTEGFDMGEGKYFPQNAYVGVTTDGKNIVLYPGLNDGTVMQLVYDMETKQVSGMVITMDPAPDDAMLTALMTQRCGINVNKTDADAVTYILNQFAELSSK